MSAVKRIALFIASAALLQLGFGSGVPRANAASAEQSARSSPRVMFNDPRGQGEKRKAISAELRKLIDAATPNSLIQVAIWGFEDQSIAKSLVAASTKRVLVQAIADDGRQGAGNSNWNYLKAALDYDGRPESWAYVCHNGCLGTGMMHNKFVLFSSTTKGASVVFQTSANFHDGRKSGSGDNMWNNSVTVVGNTGLYNSYARYFNDMSKERQDIGDYYAHREAQLPNEFGSFKPSYFPKKGRGDPIVDILNDVKCPKKDRRAPRPVVRLAMANFTRVEVAKKLRTMARHRCDIQVIYNDPGQGVARVLRESSIRSARLSTLHSKYLAIEGQFGGRAGQKRVWTGSHNYTYPALREHDEVLLRIEDQTVHDKFRGNFGQLLAAARAA